MKYLQKYIFLLERYLDFKINYLRFELEYLKLFKQERTLPINIYKQLNDLFLLIDDYAHNPLLTKVNSMKEEELRNQVNHILTQLRKNLDAC